MKPPTHPAKHAVIAALLFGAVAACSSEDAGRPAGSVSSAATTSSCGTAPFLTSLVLTDANGNAVSSIAPNTTYVLRASGPASAFCLTLTGGGALSGGGTTSCRDNSFPTPTSPSGTTSFTVVSTSTCAFTGNIVPYDSCVVAQPATSFTLPAGQACTTGGRHYTCGYAVTGHNCDNYRDHATVVAADMTAAIAACHAAEPASEADFCYVIDADGGTPSDVNECAAAAASWRSGNNCCNFKGTLSCPVSAPRHYTCGYAVAGNNCDNWRSSTTLTASDMTAAIAACHASPAGSGLDFCYVRDADGATAADPIECAAASASWRSGNSCCNFEGTLSCP